MQAKDIRGRSQKYPAGVAYKKLRQLDDTLQRERQKRHVMGKAEFRRKLMRRLHHVRLDEEGRTRLQDETPTPEE